MRPLIGLILITGTAHAGVVYDLNTRSLITAGADPVVTHYAIQGDKVRAAAADGKMVFIFKEQTIYSLDTTAKTVTAAKYATLEQVAAKLTHSVNELDDAASSAPPEQRAAMEMTAQQLRELNDRQAHRVRDYQATQRYESVSGHRCRIHEERESGVKRLELCVAPTGKVSGGLDVLAGMKTLSQYYRGSTFALGVEYGPAPWWSGIEGLDGVPLLVREFQDDKPISETTLTAIHVEVPNDALFDLPAGYSVQEQRLGDP